MKKTILTLTLFASCFTVSMAQKLRTYDKLVYVKTQNDGSDVSISIESPVANDKQLKFKLKIVNKTNDYIVFKPSECKLMVNGKEFKPNAKEKELVISPLDNDSKVINIFGEGLNAARSCTFNMDGVYKVSSKETGVDAADFKLPVSKYDFAAGQFNVTSTKLYKESDATDAQFSVSYTGDKMGAVFFTNATVLMPDGNEYSATKSTGLFAKSGMKIIQKGTTEDFTLHWNRMEGGKAMDMQKVPMTIKWHNTFCEISPKPLPTVVLSLEIDETLSK